MAPHAFDPGYVTEPFRSLVADYPGEETFPPAEFRTEWGPIFHRGRLDGSARVLVLGQDPAQHESVVRRILVGAAGQRAQGFLAKLGIDTSYVMVNTFLYSVAGGAGAGRVDDPEVVRYRNRWLDALLVGQRVEAVVAMGGLADQAFKLWQVTPAGQGVDVAYEHVTHPTAPESGARGDVAKRAALTRAMLANWNDAIERLRPRIQHPDSTRAFVRYGNALRAAEYGEIPAADLPAGLPDWMRSRSWADRKGRGADAKRATIVMTVPADQRHWV